MIEPKEGDVRFKKYQSIDNHYQNKVIHGWKTYYPQVSVSKFIGLEKIDGSNFQIYIDNLGNVSYSSRNNILELEDSLGNYQQVMAKHSEKIDKLKKYATINNKTLRIYGEIFGEHLKRVDYGKGSDFLPFEVFIDEQVLSKKDAMQFFEDVLGHYWFAPIVAYFDDIDSALAFELETYKEDGSLDKFIETKAIIGEQEEGSYRAIEGIVITAYDTVIGNDDKSFMIKLKSKKFNDKSSKKQKVKEEFKGSDEYHELVDIWAGMINENRLLDLFSKEGEISDPKQIGKYIGLMLNDVKEDFFKEYKDRFVLLDDKERKRIISSTSTYLLPLLRKYL